MLKTTIDIDELLILSDNEHKEKIINILQDELCLDYIARSSYDETTLFNVYCNGNTSIITVHYICEQSLKKRYIKLLRVLRNDIRIREPYLQKVKDAVEAFENKEKHNKSKQ